MTIQDLLNTNPSESTYLNDIVINVKDSEGDYESVARIIFEFDSDGAVYAVIEVEREFK